jgi:TRAP-type transport system periplasmic protein
VVALAMASLGHRELALRSRAVKAPNDLAGLKVRVLTPPVLTALYGALGAQPQTMPYAQAQAALAAGTLDGQDGSPATFVGARLDALGLKWVLEWGAVAEIAVFAVNRARWNALNDAQQALLRDSAKESARELDGLVRKENDSAREALRKGGMTVIRLTPTGRAAFVAATRGLYDTRAADAGVLLARAAEAAVKAVPP